MQPETDREGEAAGAFFGAAANTSPEALLEAVPRAEQFAKRGLSGRGPVVTPALLTFCGGLIFDIEHRDGKLTCWRKDCEPQGTLITAVEILKPYLPDGFVPNTPARVLQAAFNHFKKK